MQAVRAHEGGELRFEQADDPVAGPGEVVVELRFAGLNRRDLLVTRGVYPFSLPLVPGSDGAGVRRDTGEEVVVYPALRWGEREDAPGEGWEILGGPSDGTYAELVKVPEANVAPRPKRFSWEESAVFALGGLTAYRALFSRAGLRSGETVLLLGAGSGVTSLGVSLAAQAGARVLVTSSSAEKIERAKELGAEGGVLYTEGGWPEEVKALAGGRVDVVLDSVGSTWADSARCLRPGGRLVVFGATGGTEVALEVRPFYFGQLSMLGTTMGSPRDFAGLMEMVIEGRWKPVLDSVRPLEEAGAALERLESGDHFGKLALAVD